MSTRNLKSGLTKLVSDYKIFIVVACIYYILDFLGNYIFGIDPEMAHLEILLYVLYVAKVAIGIIGVILGITNIVFTSKSYTLTGRQKILRIVIIVLVFIFVFWLGRMLFNLIL